MFQVGLDFFPLGFPFELFGSFQFLGNRGPWRRDDPGGQPTLQVRATSRHQPWDRPFRWLCDSLAGRSLPNAEALGCFFSWGMTTLGGDKGSGDDVFL